MTCGPKSNTGNQLTDCVVTYIRQEGNNCLGADLSDLAEDVEVAKLGCVMEKARTLCDEGLVRNIGYDYAPRYRFEYYERSQLERDRMLLSAQERAREYSLETMIASSCDHLDTPTKGDSGGKGGSDGEKAKGDETSKIGDEESAVAGEQGLAGGTADRNDNMDEESIDDSGDEIVDDDIDDGRPPRGIIEDLALSAPRRCNGVDAVHGYVMCPGCKAHTSIYVQVYQRVEESPTIQAGCRWMDDPGEVGEIEYDAGDSGTKTEVARTGRMGSDLYYCCEWCEKPFYVATRVLKPERPYVEDPKDKRQPEHVPRQATYTGRVREKRNDRQFDLYERQGLLGYDPALISLSENQIRVLEKRQKGFTVFGCEETLIRDTEATYYGLVGVEVNLCDRSARRFQWEWFLHVRDMMKKGLEVSQSTRLAQSVLAANLCKYKKTAKLIKK